MNDNPDLDQSTLDKIEELKRQRKLTLPVGSNPMYNTLTARIQYLRNRKSIREGIYAWRKKNESRIKYERTAGIAYNTPKKKKPLTEDQRIARNAAVRKHDRNNPQRSIRQGIERVLLYFYGMCADGRLQKRARPRIESLLGCKPEEFREHIRSQLARKGWLWSEWREKWTMDHVIPVRRFNLPEQQYACWHYTNLRPLDKSLNHSGLRN